ncbi:MAG: asparaginase domain-containing protein [Phycisphaerales bacterium]|jgi:L-asparaginase|nr:asparaginase [Phycisphaeraceae bacterium]
MRSITLITTGGTIEKTYDEQTGSLDNRRSIVRRMLRRIRLEDTSVSIIELMSKDSLLMTDEDRARISGAVVAAGATTSGALCAGVVILHGTDTLCVTGELLHATLRPVVPVVLTGAMRPFEMTRTDALQNLTEAIFSTGVLAPGVYAAAHGRAIAFPGVIKDRERGTFVRVKS